MISSDDENPPPQSDPNSIAAFVSSPPPGDESYLRRPPENGEGAHVAVLPASDPPPPHNNDSNIFSIREYVFRSRSKDIFTNWPFSQKNLQLCLKHSVKEVLPPFQHLDTEICRSFELPKVENRSVVANFKSEPSGSKLKKVPSLQGLDHVTELNVYGAASSKQLDTVRSSARDDVPLVASWVSRVSTEQVTTKEAATPAACLKSGSSVQSTGKKCRFTMTFGTKYERSFGDDTVSNCTSVSENMGSKVCPVCKTFLLSSNTTLNAHIDQCLSLRSAPQRLPMHHRIKPRKTKLMADIYETARRCTIEEVDQRNGLNLANTSSLPSPNSDVASDEERRPSMSMARTGNSGDGGVYIDTNGTKLRILSKFEDDQPELGSAKGVLLKTSSQGKKGSGIFKKNMKKLHRQKHYKHIKLASKGKRLHSQKANETQKNPRGRQEGSEGYPGCSQSSLGLLKHSLSGTLKQWSSSKRIGPKKKFVTKEGEALLMPIRSCFPKLLNTSEDSDYSRCSESENERSWPDCRGAREQEQPMICKTSLAWSDVTPDSVVKWGCPPVKRKSLPEEDHLREVSVSKIKKNIGHGKSQIKWKRIETGSTSGRQLRPRPSSTKNLRFSTLKKRVFYPCESYENSSGISAGRTDFCLESQRLHLSGASRQMSEDPVRDQSVEEGADFQLSSDESSERETASLREVAETDDPYGEVQYSVSTSHDVSNTEPLVEAIEDCAWGLSKYYEPSHLDVRDCSQTHPGSRRFLGISEVSLCGAEDEFSRAFQACEDMNMGNAINKDNEVNGAGQSSSFLEIDPIPIPGPPGSFLPSPGAMGSEDFQGNSSLTTSQAQSSHDEEDLVDGDTSDSPISATSTISNSAEAKARTDYLEELVSRGRPLLPEDTWAVFSRIGNDVSTTQQEPSAAMPPSCSALGEAIAGANNVSIKKGPPFTGHVNIPCCCQKEERAVSQRSVLDNRKSEPPGPRRCPSVAVPRMECRTNKIPSDGSRSEERYEGAIPKPANPSEILSSMSFGEFPSSSGRTDCDFQSPSGSNPVLRLMGKDLIVVNKEDNPGTPDRSQSSAPPGKRPEHIAVCSMDHQNNEMDYPPARSMFMGSSSGYPGITMPVTVQAPERVHVGCFTSPEVAGSGLNSSVRPVFSSKHMTPKASPLINPGEASEFTLLAAANSMSIPRDAFMLPQTLPTAYLARGPTTTLDDPAVELARKGKPGDNAEVRLVQRAPAFVVSPWNFVGYHGSGYVHYRS